MTASASPVVVQSPSLPQVVVGLRQGATGNNVVALQNALLDAGVKVPGGADGFFGPATKSALTAFQSRSGLTTSGKVDEATAAALGLAAPAPAAASQSGAALSVGATGEAVKQLQAALMASGVFVPGGADGVFGPATKTAVSNFQRWNGLTVTGEVDATTASRLQLGSGSSASAGPSGVSKPSPAASTGTDFVGMKTGARGDNVKVLQRALIAAGISVRGGADGVFGPMTAAALTSYQQANGIATTGVVDEVVVSQLKLTSGAPAPAAAPAPAPADPGSSHVGLRVGSTGKLVQELQRALMDAGLALRGGADGAFGNMTKATLQQYQKAAGREQTGVVTSADAASLGLGTSSAPQGVTSPVGFAVFGERGDRVKALQQSLLAAGITFAGGADGVFGAATSGALLAFQRREGLPATGKVDQATADRLGSVKAPAPAPPSSAGVSLDAFPVQGKCWFGDTWMAPRSGGRLHQGVDIISARGNLLYAVVSGTISKVYADRPGALAGNGVRIAQDNGTYFTYLHMDTFAEGIELGAKVKAGQVIGTVGSTGNAATPHLHFEVHPRGGAAVNPYPLVKPIDGCNITAPRG